MRDAGRARVAAPAYRVDWTGKGRRLRRVRRAAVSGDGYGCVAAFSVACAFSNQGGSEPQDM
jgi:hypothetical protein